MVPTRSHASGLLPLRRHTELLRRLNHIFRRRQISESVSHRTRLQVFRWGVLLEISTFASFRFQEGERERATRFCRSCAQLAPAPSGRFAHAFKFFVRGSLLRSPTFTTFIFQNKKGFVQAVSNLHRPLAGGSHAGLRELSQGGPAPSGTGPGVPQDRSRKFPGPATGFFWIFRPAIKRFAVIVARLTRGWHTLWAVTGPRVSRATAVSLGWPLDPRGTGPEVLRFYRSHYLFGLGEQMSFVGRLAER